MLKELAGQMRPNRAFAVRVVASVEVFVAVRTVEQQAGRESAFVVASKENPVVAQAEVPLVAGVDYKENC